MSDSDTQALVRKPSSHDYSAAELQEANVLSLARVPVSDCAVAFVNDVAERLHSVTARKTSSEKPVPSRKRDKGHDKRVTETGIILAGLLCRGFKGKWCLVNQSSSGWFWRKERKLPFGHNAFWTKISALVSLGLVEQVAGKGWQTDRGNYTGESSRLRPSKTLLSIAESHGCTKDTAASDWRLCAPALVRDNPVPVLIDAFEGMSGADLPSVSAGLVSFMDRLSDVIAHHHISGCARPVLQMKFIGSEAFHGRVYAKGVDNFQSLPREERRHIKIDDEPVQEVDIAASFLSIAMLLTGHVLPSGDPYALQGIDAVKCRQAVKQWFVVTLSLGKPCSRWPAKTADEIKKCVPAKSIKQAAVAQYPFLENLVDIVQKRDLESVPEKERCKAIGLYLMALEARVIRKASSDIMEQGGIALPLHDALMVPASWAERTREAIMKASKEQLGNSLRVTLGK